MVRKQSYLVRSPPFVAIVISSKLLLEFIRKALLIINKQYRLD